MNAEQLIKHCILVRAHEAGDITLGDEPITADNVEEIFDANNDDYQLQDYMTEFREGTVETGLSCDYSRHYESKSVAAKMPDGQWLGWTYWYGGGKHGEPEAIDWINEAYFLDCAEEEKLVIVQTFTKKGG